MFSNLSNLSFAFVYSHLLTYVCPSLSGQSPVALPVFHSSVISYVTLSF